MPASLPRLRQGLFRHGLLALACVAALAGCASTGGLEPRAKPLDGNALSAGESLGQASPGSARFPAADWWKALGDPQLDALIAEALRGNPSLDAADARLRQARAQASLSDAARKPTLGASAQYSGVQLPETLAGPELGGDYLGSTVLMLNFSYKLDPWGGDKAKWLAAVGQAKAAEVDAQAARLTLSTNVARAYVGLAQAHAMRDVAENEHRRATHLLELSRQRVAAGLDNLLQQRQAESMVAGANLQVEAARQQIDAAGNSLAALLGQGPDRALRIQRPAMLQAPAPAPAVPGVLPSELLGHRPDVVAARWRVEAANHGIKAAKAAFKPSVNLTALAGLASSGLSDLFSNDALLGFGGPAISLPIFDGGRLRGQLDSRDADYDLAVAGYNQTLVGALHQVTDAVQGARSLDQQLAAAHRARDAAQAALQLAQARYRAGLGTQIDVLTAQRPLLQLEQQTAALQAQRLATAIDLDAALGGGLVLESPSSALADTSVNP